LGASIDAEAGIFPIFFLKKIWPDIQDLLAGA
jgi:hypothetical protein